PVLGRAGAHAAVARIPISVVDARGAWLWALAQSFIAPSQAALSGVAILYDALRRGYGWSPPTSTKHGKHRRDLQAKMRVSPLWTGRHVYLLPHYRRPSASDNLPQTFWLNSLIYFAFLVVGAQGLEPWTR